MNKSAKSRNNSKSPNKSKSSKSRNNSKSKSPKANEDTEAARVAEVAWGMAYMNEVWKNVYEKAGEEMKANMKR